MLAAQNLSLGTYYPSWLDSFAISDGSSCADHWNVTEVQPHRHTNHLLAPQPRTVFNTQTNHCKRHFIGSRPPTPFHTVARRSPQSDRTSSSSTPVTQYESDGKAGPSTLVSSARPGRVSLPLPFPEARIENRIHFHSRGQRGISLAAWDRLSEKRKTYLALEDPHESVDEPFLNDVNMLFQSHWPGYDVRTCYIDMPVHVTEGGRAFTKVNLLDMVCQALVDWVVNITNSPHVECREPHFTIGLNRITFKHIYVTSVVEIKGYVSKWVPVLEIDPQAFQF